VALKNADDMITFGYKNKFSGFIRAILAIAIGVVMVASKTNALELAVRIIAAFLVATGVVTFILGVKTKNGGENNLMSVNAIVDVFLGVLLFLFPEFVVNIMIYIIGFAIIAFGLFQIIALVSAVRVYQVGVWSFILPTLVVIAGVFLVARPSFVGEAMGVVAGAALIVYGTSELFSTWKMRKAIKEYDIKQAPKTSNTEADVKIEAEDVEYQKVDE
jgi:uncharacterized membrane protein HdeD (DUF308 family)